MPLASGPSITDWLSAIGQVFGAVGTLAAVAVALVIATRDNRRLVAEARDRDASVARLVTATLRRDVGLVFLEIRNDSSETIYQPVVEIAPSSGVNYKVTDQKVEKRNGRFVPVDYVGEALSFIPPRETVGLLVQTDGSAVFPAPIKIGFIDAEGRKWIRQGNFPPQRELSG